MNDSAIYFLTGATGLLGRFILLRLLQAGQRVVVLVRSTPFATAQQRIEQVLQPFEVHTLLPRPQILVGELNLPKLGLAADAIESLKGCSLRVIHSAASIRFVAEGRDGTGNQVEDSQEPYATNVVGTRNLLELIKQWDVQDFHHVSTAYVGVRQGLRRVPEDWVPEDCSGGNDYERSKILAEALVRNCEWLRARVIHRPSIIVGDSKTGFTSTFHGFYAPLQIGAQYAQRFGLDRQVADLFRQRLGIAHGDCKNLVTVDWVADAISGVAMSPAQRSDRILHWTNPAPVPCGEMQESILESLQSHFGGSSAGGGDGDDVANAAGVLARTDEFRQQMRVYESYFGADPEFVGDNGRMASQQAATAVSRCPVVDRSLMRRLAEYALQTNFGWPRPRPVAAPSELVAAVLDNWIGERAVWRGANTNAQHVVQLDLLGPWAPERLWLGRFADGWRRLPAATTADMQWIVPLNRMVDCIIGKVGLIELIDQGYWVIRGSHRGEWLEIVNDWVKDVNSRIPTRLL